MSESAQADPSGNQRLGVELALPSNLPFRTCDVQSAGWGTFAANKADETLAGSANSDRNELDSQAGESQLGRQAIRHHNRYSVRRR